MIEEKQTELIEEVIEEKDDLKIREEEKRLNIIDSMDDIFWLD